jgi:uncharacterized glyoxalase superfamily protein PhnB
MDLNCRLDSKVLVVSLAFLAFTAISMAHSSEVKMMINKSTPILHVKAVEPSLKFWTERFGFKATIEVPEGDHIGFVAIENGSVELMYQTYEGMKGDGALAQAVEQGPSFIFMEVPDISAIKKALQPTEVVQDIHETFYGAKEIVAKEPGGHYVIFSQLPPQPKQ